MLELWPDRTSEQGMHSETVLEMWTTRVFTSRMQSGKREGAEVWGHTSARINEDPSTTDDCLSLGASIYCNGYIEGKQVKMLVDTGSVIS